MKASDNAFPSILITEGTEPAAPAAGKQRVYIDSSTHHLKRTDSSGTDVDIEAAAGGVATDAIWDAAGDLAVGTGANTAAKLTKGAAGTVPTAGASTVAYAYPPGYEFDYVESTTTTNLTATTEDTANTIVTGSAVAYDGSTAVLIEFFAPQVQVPAAATNNYAQLYLYDGAASIGNLGVVFFPNSGAGRAPVRLTRRLTPSAASHTYSIRGAVASGTGAVVGGAGGHAAGMPAFIRITKA